MDAIRYVLIILKTYVRKQSHVGVYEEEFYKDTEFDPDDDGNSWESVYRLMRCPKPKARGAGF